MTVQTGQHRPNGELEHLATLFREDRLAFERERRRLIREAIDSYEDEKIRAGLERQQQLLDRALRGSGSAENRLALIRALFWDQVVNRFLPALDGTSGCIKKAAAGPGEVPAPRPRLTLVRGPGK